MDRYSMARYSILESRRTHAGLFFKECNRRFGQPKETHGLSRVLESLARGINSRVRNLMHIELIPDGNSIIGDVLFEP